MSCDRCGKMTSKSMCCEVLCISCSRRDAEAIEKIRAEERERCAKAIEADRDRIFEQSGAFVGELAMYDVCALVVRQLSGRKQN